MNKEKKEIKRNTKKKEKLINKNKKWYRRKKYAQTEWKQKKGWFGLFGFMAYQPL